MITSAEEFIHLRKSQNPEEYNRSAYEPAELSVWHDVINKFPEYKKWIIHNKTVQIEILELLSEDEDPDVRCEVARKRKINDKIFHELSQDSNESVRYALMCNTKISVELKCKIKTDDSKWLIEQLNKIIQQDKRE